MILLILFLALVLRMVNLNQSVWLDEAVQAITAQNSVSYLFREIIGDFHPPAYHLLMHYWVKVFGFSEISLRLPSVLFGVGTVGIVYLIIKKLTNSKINALIGALILAMAPFHVYYSQEARMYAMSCFLTALSMYFLLIINKSKKNRIFYLISIIFLIYTDYYGFLILLAQGIYLFMKKQYKFLIFSLIFIILFYFPWLPMLNTQWHAGILATRELPGWGRLVNVNFLKAIPLTFVKFSFGRITVFNRTAYALVSGAVLLFYGWLILKNFRKKPLWLSLWLLVPMAIAWGVSLVVPNYQPFRLLLVLPAFYLLVVLGISEIKKKRIRFLAIGIILLINIFSLGTYYFNPYFQREDWREVAGKVKEAGSPIVISSSAFNWPLVYYGVGDKVISASRAVKAVSVENKDEFNLRITGEDKIFYTPYLADIYDPPRSVVFWIEESGFVKMNEYSFNQIPLWEYKR